MAAGRPELSAPELCVGVTDGDPLALKGSMTVTLLFFLFFPFQEEETEGSEEVKGVRVSGSQ